MTGQISKKTELQLYALVFTTWFSVVGLTICACATPSCGLRILGALVGMGACWTTCSMIGSGRVVRLGCEV
jgi:hypothetical protein